MTASGQPPTDGPAKLIAPTDRPHVLTGPAIPTTNDKGGRLQAGEVRGRTALLRKVTQGRASCRADRR
jgi:hypothetical protein